MLIDPQAISFDDSYDASPYIDGDTISYVQFATKHRFLLRGDTLSYIGYENRATDFRLDSPAVAAAFPLTDGKSVSDVWSGHMLHYGSMVLRHVRGISASSIDGGWTLTDGTDTLRNAMRLLWRLDMAYADPDSVSAAMPDSVASEKISDIQVDVKAMLSERMLTERTMWLSADARYPVLTDSRVSRILLDEAGAPADTVPLSMLAMYYPAPFQYSDTGEEITVRKQGKTQGGNTYDASDDGLPDTGTTLSVGEPEVGERIISVTLSSPSGPVVATVTLFSDSGIMLTEPKSVIVGTVPQSHSVEAPSGWSGIMLLRVDTGEESYTRKIIR